MLTLLGARRGGGELVTGCLYISPANMPVVMADAMVLDSLPPQRMVLPANVYSGSVVADLRQTKLARKLYLIEPRTAVAFAGDALAIQDCLRYISALMPTLANEERPLKRISAQVDDYNGAVQYIGIHMPEDVALTPALQIDRFHRSCPRNSMFNLPIFNVCSSIGSGAKELKQIATLNDVDAQRISREIQSSSAESISLGTVNSIAHRVLLSEMALIPSPNTWGGYFEYAYFNMGTRMWERGPRTLNLFYVATFDGPRRFSLQTVAKAILEPGQQHGYVAALDARTDPCIIFDYTLIDLLADQAAASFGSRWYGWTPEVAVASVVWLQNGKKITRTTAPNEVGNIVFKLSQGETMFGLKQDFVDVLGQSAAEIWGLEYVPHREEEGLR